ncbi:MAG: hypothetical protein AB1545_09450 [Thermodesulfobacteriota bacterium]|jgi:hypothetical protein
MRRSFHTPAILFTTILYLLQTADAWALQSHGEPEGLYVHQMAHVLFMGALAYLYWHTRRTTSLTSKGWRYLRLFCFLLFFWNLMAFTGHEFSVRLSPDDLIDIGTWREQLAPPIGLFKIIYFIVKMDHFLNVPALLALFISLRTFYLEAKAEIRQ